MSFKLNILKTNVINTFFIVIFVFFVIIKNENRLLSEINKIFTHLFFIKGFFELGFLCEIIIIII